MRLKALALALVLILSRATLVVGAELVRSIDIDFRPEAITKLLTQQTVIQVFQDSRGALWILTQEGLNKYNGLELENYKYSQSDPNSISSNAVTRILEDLQGKIWISTIGGGLNQYNPATNTFSALYTSNETERSPKSNDIHTIFRDSDGTLLAWL